MASELTKHLDRARRGLEKNKLREALAEYQAVLAEMPANQEALQALPDLYTRLGDSAKAAHYYGIQFDKLIDAGDSAKAGAIFTRFLRQFPQPPDRLMRYAMLLQKQGRSGDAIEQYQAAAGVFQQQQRGVEALACYESVALLDPDNPARHFVLAEFAARLGHVDLATRSYVRAGQLILAGGALDEALEYFRRAHELSPDDRTCALLYAEAQLRKGDAETAVQLLKRFSPNAKDTAFLAVLGEALLRTKRLDEARSVFEAYYKEKPDGFEKLFEVAGAYAAAGQDEKAAAVLFQTKDWMRGVRKEVELSAQLDRISADYPNSLRIAEAVAKICEELNREAKYFDALVRLFDLYLEEGRVKDACDALDRLVDIDPYDYRNHERIERLQGRADPAFLQTIVGRAAKAATVSPRTGGFSGAGSEPGATVAVSDEQRAQQALEDLIVQVEIFLQYGLQSKAVERLEKIAELFPGEGETNERLRAVYERANWWPKGEARRPPAISSDANAPGVASGVSGENSTAGGLPSTSAAEMHRDLTAIAEINRSMYRQATPQEVLSTTAAEIGKHLGAARCLVAVGTSTEAGQTTAEYSAPGLAAAAAARVASVASLVCASTPDSLGGVSLSAASVPPLAELGMDSGLGVILIDKDAQAPAGALVVADSKPRVWKANETFFLQAVGDQLLISVNHTRLRSLVRSLSVADEKTGVLNRSAYLDCLLAEANRARSQGTSLSLIILQADHGGELLRQHGEAAIERYVDEIARGLASSIRQTDLIVKYTTWSLAFVLPGTTLENAQALAEKLRQAAAAVRPSWGTDLTVSAVAAESASRPGDETEDRVTEIINRAESGLDEARQRGGDTLVALATP
ncbi:MAG TPA: tetratricopeptide repeat protein [Candidatus Acidoferrales bacterium]|nr:tetratricopeptide repeat protein [Candidatus Acidoferrales bacterium]